MTYATRENVLSPGATRPSLRVVKGTKTKSGPKQAAITTSTPSGADACICSRLRPLRLLPLSIVPIHAAATSRHEAIRGRSDVMC